jgi:hypothetical protein
MSRRRLSRAALVRIAGYKVTYPLHDFRRPETIISFPGVVSLAEHKRLVRIWTGRS